MEPPTWLTIALIRGRLEASGAIHVLHKQIYGRPCTAMSPASSAMVLEHFTQSPQKSTKYCARETGFSKSSIKLLNRKLTSQGCYLSWMKMILNQELFQHKVHEDEKLVRKIVWSDEATFKLNGTVNCHKYVYWAPENPHIHVEKMVNLPRLAVCNGLSYGCFNGTILFCRSRYWPRVPQHASDILCTCHSSALWEWAICFQLDGAPPPWHRDVRSYFWWSLKDVVYHRKPPTLEML
jgi:hypothetical protein